MPPSSSGPGDLLKTLAELGAGFVPVLGEGLSLRDAYRAYQKKDKLGIGLGLLGALPMVGMIGKAGKFAKGADVVERAMAQLAKEEGIAAELAKTAIAAKHVPAEEAVARRMLRPGELVASRGNEAGIKTVATRYPGHELPMVSKFIEKIGQHEPQAAANLQEFMKGSVIKQAQAHGTTSDFAVFNKTRDIGFHVGTPGQASAILDRPDTRAWHQLRQDYEKAMEGVGGPWQERPDFYTWLRGQPGGSELLSTGLHIPKPKANVMAPLAVHAENPLIVSDLGEWNPSDLFSDIERRAITVHNNWNPEKIGNLPADVWVEKSQRLLGQMAEGNRGTPDLWAFLKDAHNADALQYLNTAEDVAMGAHTKQPVSGWSFIVPKSEQIKSILGNVGTYSRQNPNILLGLGGIAGLGLLSQNMQEQR